MGYALVYSGEHFVTDILAGWVMAGLASAAVAVAFRAARRLRAGATLRVPMSPAP
jgi:membrane-associated phospholipid phosphatase